MLRARGAWGTAFAQGDLDEARTLIEAAQADAKALGFRLVEARALHQLGVIAIAQGNLDHATTLLIKVETDYRDVGSWIDIAYCRNDLGYVRLIQGNTDEAMTLFEDAMAIARERGIRLPSHSYKSAWGMRCPLTGTSQVQQRCTGVVLLPHKNCPKCGRWPVAFEAWPPSLWRMDGLHRLCASSLPRKRCAHQIASISLAMPTNAERGISPPQEPYSVRLRSPSPGMRARKWGRRRLLPRRQLSQRR